MLIQSLTYIIKFFKADLQDLSLRVQIAWARLVCYDLYLNTRWYGDIRGDFKLHVYDKRQTSDSSWEVLKIENEQIKAAQNSSYG